MIQNSKLCCFVSEAAYVTGRDNPARAEFMRGVEEALAWVGGGLPSATMQNLIDAAHDEMAEAESMDWVAVDA